jgi:2-polyprenyl-6-methoxyphenol hydroxylase-like FAD-dependent oxidoreductase
LKKWCREGLLCIGDNAHAMSPAGGVGINLALQDAVATANLLAAKLKDRAVTVSELEQVQKRREFPVKFIQALQVQIHKRINGRTSGSGDQLPLLPRLFLWFPFLRGIPARFIGLGPRPEHVHSPAFKS